MREILKILWSLTEENTCFISIILSDPVRVRKWSQDRKWSLTANDPGPEMIPDGDRKWSLMGTANDPDWKIRNGMDEGMVRIGNWIG